MVLALSRHWRRKPAMSDYRKHQRTMLPSLQLQLEDFVSEHLFDPVDLIETQFHEEFDRFNRDAAMKHDYTNSKTTFTIGDLEIVVSSETISNVA